MNTNNKALLAGMTSLAFSLILASGGCSSSEDTLPDQTAEAMQNYARIVEASYVDSLTGAQMLDQKVKAFVALPSEQSLGQAREAWLASREPFLQTEVYRFYDGPIDREPDGPEGLINAWPLDENYIDYVVGNPNAGIVNNPAQVISEANLLALNEQGKPENIATGFHAVEFLLWGQDVDPNGPGNRPFTDFVDPANGGRANYDRRGLYLTTVSGMLVKHIDMMVKAWAPNVPTNYRTQFLAMTPKEQLEKVLAGMIILSGFETGGERIRTALDSKDQEDEHSCFSDNTHRDMVQDVQGILNVWRGSYRQLNGTEIKGPGVYDVVKAQDLALANQVDAAIVASHQAALALVPPFDQEIVDSNPAGRARVEALETALRAQERLLSTVFTTFGLAVPPNPT